MPDLFQQTRPAAGYPADAKAFADTLERIMAGGTHELAAIAAALNEGHVAAGGCTNWTPESLGAYLARLANA